MHNIAQHSYAINILGKSSEVVSAEDNNLLEWPENFLDIFPCELSLLSIVLLFQNYILGCTPCLDKAIPFI